MPNPILVPLSLPNKRPVMATLVHATHTTILVSLNGETITFTRQGDRLGVGTPYKIAPQFLQGIPRPKGRPPTKPKTEPAPVGRPKEPPKERTRFDFRLPKSTVDTIDAIRQRTPGSAVEVLVSDFQGNQSAADIVIAAAPDVFNHNTETVPRLQRAVRPSAGYARSLALLSRAGEAGLRTKSGLIVGMGETDDEVFGVLADLAGIGCRIVTIGQYLRPTSNHLPVHRWVTPATFDEYRRVGRELGLEHVEASPLTRSSYHAREAAASSSSA